MQSACADVGVTGADVGVTGADVGGGSSPHATSTVAAEITVSIAPIRRAEPRRKLLIASIVGPLMRYPSSAIVQLLERRLDFVSVVS